MQYAVYITASRPHGAIYTGVTNDLARRTHEHRQGLIPGFAGMTLPNKPPPSHSSSPRASENPAEQSTPPCHPRESGDPDVFQSHHLDHHPIATTRFKRQLTRRPKPNTGVS